MNDHIDTRDGWREVQSNENHQRRLVEYNEDNRVAHIWVRKQPVLPLPTVAYTVIRVTSKARAAISADDVLTLHDGEMQFWVDASGHAYEHQGTLLQESITGFEVLAEPLGVLDKHLPDVIKKRVRRETAKAVLDRVDEIADGTWGETRDKIAREFGLGS